MTPIGLPDDADDASEECHALAVFDPPSEATRDATAVLTVPERQAAWALANGKTAKDAAKAAGVSERTVWRWVKKPYFRDALREAGEFALQLTDAAPMSGKARVQRRTPEVAERLVQIALNDEHPDQFRAISKALEVAGLTGGKGSTQQTNVQVNVSTDGAHRTAQDEALRIIEARKADVSQAAADG